MSRNTFNLEVIERAKVARAAVEQIPAEVRKGSQAFQEMADFTNSPKLKAVSENLTAASERYCRATEALLEKIDNYANHYRNVQDVL